MSGEGMRAGAKLALTDPYVDEEGRLWLENETCEALGGCVERLERARMRVLEVLEAPNRPGVVVGDRFEAAGWVTTASDELQRSFEGVFEGSFGRRRRQETHPALQLFVSGRLLVQSVSQTAAARIGCVFVGWLVEANVSDEEG